MKTPYLIQRCTINRPLVNDRLSKAVKLDYMGSAEFEFGATAQSLRALQETANQRALITDCINCITDGKGRSIRVLHAFDGPELSKYLAFIARMRNSELLLKEDSGFDPRWPRSDADLWWDIENHVFWSFDKIFMNRLTACLAASWKYMDAQKA